MVPLPQQKQCIEASTIEHGNIAYNGKSGLNVPHMSNTEKDPAKLKGSRRTLRRENENTEGRHILSQSTS